MTIREVALQGILTACVACFFYAQWQPRFALRLNKAFTVLRAIYSERSFLYGPTDEATGPRELTHELRLVRRAISDDVRKEQRRQHKHQHRRRRHHHRSRRSTNTAKTGAAATASESE